MEPNKREKIYRRSRATAMPVDGASPAGKLIGQLREDNHALIRGLEAAEARELLWKSRADVLTARLSREAK